jgi:hypothetical protein
MQVLKVLSGTRPTNQKAQKLNFAGNLRRTRRLPSMCDGPNAYRVGYEGRPVENVADLAQERAESAIWISPPH